jgi:hypothetical protein
MSEMIAELHHTSAKNSQLSQLKTTVNNLEEKHQSTTEALEKEMRDSLSELNSTFEKTINELNEKTEAASNLLSDLNSKLSFHEKRQTELENISNDHKTLLSAMKKKTGYDHDLITETNKVLLARITRIETQLFNLPSASYNTNNPSYQRNPLSTMAVQPSIPTSGPGVTGSSAKQSNQFQNAAKIMMGGGIGAETIPNPELAFSNDNSNIHVEVMSKQLENLKNMVETDIIQRVFENQTALLDLRNKVKMVQSQLLAPPELARKKSMN